MDAGLSGAIAGSVVGLMGGIIGTYFGIKNTNGPRERAFAIRGAIAMWLWLTAMMGCIFLMPRPWNQIAVLLTTAPLPFVILMGNRWQARARSEDEAEAKLP